MMSSLDERAGERSVVGLDAWNAEVASTFDNLFVDADRTSFKGRMDVRDLGGMDLSQIASSAAVVRRGTSNMARRPYFKLHVQDVGRSLNLQEGREAVLDEGDLMLCDPARPYTIRFDDVNRMLVLRIPSERLADRMDNPEALCGRRDPELSVGRVAGAIGVSPRYVQMVFAGMATTPLAYIRRKRLERAALALRDTGGACNITELSFSLGFNDLSHFSRAFKASYGIGPREFRAS